MRLLGQVRSTGCLYSPIDGGMFGASLDGGFERAGASARGYDCWIAAGSSPTPNACPSVATNHWTWTDGYRNRAYNTPGSLASMGTTPCFTSMHSAWTTGLVVVSGVRGAYPTIIVRSGYDYRTSMGSGHGPTGESASRQLDRIGLSNARLLFAIRNDGWYRDLALAVHSGAFELGDVRRWDRDCLECSTGGDANPRAVHVLTLK